MQREQVFGTAYLARAVAFKGQTRVGLAHPHPIVDDLDECASGVLEDDLDVSCLSVNGILHQFLDDTGGALDDFSGGNLVGHRVGQQFDHITHGVSLVEEFYLLKETRQRELRERWHCCLSDGACRPRCCA